MPSGSPLRRTMMTLLMVLTVGIAAFLLSERSGPRGATNLVGLVGTEEIEAELLLETSLSREVEDVLRNELGYRLRVPGIVDATIEGVGTWDAGRNVKIPVIFYDDPSGDIRTALVLNYAILDRISAAVFLDRSIRVELEQDRSYAVVNAADDREVVLWRVGDDIFLALAEQGAGRLIPRIIQPGSTSQG
jgi:hypothetical protein